MQQNTSAKTDVRWQSFLKALDEKGMTLSEYAAMAVGRITPAWEFAIRQLKWEPWKVALAMVAEDRLLGSEYIESPEFKDKLADLVGVCLPTQECPSIEDLVMYVTKRWGPGEVNDHIHICSGCRWFVDQLDFHALLPLT